MSSYEQPDDPHAECAIEIDRLRALNAELLAMVELAVQTCSVCRGNGKLSDTHNWGACPACADLRALIARAKGEV